MKTTEEEKLEGNTDFLELRAVGKFLSKPLKVSATGFRDFDRRRPVP